MGGGGGGGIGSHFGEKASFWQKEARKVLAQELKERGIQLMKSIEAKKKLFFGLLCVFAALIMIVVLWKLISQDL